MAFLVPLLAGTATLTATGAALTAAEVATLGGLAATSVTTTAGLIGSGAAIGAGGLLTSVGGLTTVASLASGIVGGVQAFGQGQAQAESASLQQEIAAGQFTENRLRRLRAARRQLAERRARGAVAGDVSGAVQAQFLAETQEALGIERSQFGLGSAVRRGNISRARRDAGFGLGLGIAGGVARGGDRFLQRRRFGAG